MKSSKCPFHSNSRRLLFVAGCVTLLLLSTFFQALHAQGVSSAARINDLSVAQTTHISYTQNASLVPHTHSLLLIAESTDLQKSNDKVTELEKLSKKEQAFRNIVILVALLVLVLSGLLYTNNRKIRTLNRALELREKDLEELNRSKDKLFSVIGHDLRGPVSNIPTLIEIIEAENIIPQEYMELLDTLKEHTNATVETLDKLLLLGKSQMKGNDCNPIVFEPYEFVVSNIEVKTFSANSKGIKLINNTQPDTLIDADPGQFDFVVRNLLSNAIKFSHDDGEVVISSSADMIPGFIVFSVKDSGVGVNPESMQNLFKTTVNSSYGTRNEKGNGIGLMLCGEFIALNGGKIWAESKPGEGANFFFSLKASS
jgi:signal transduction histidine kinase